MIRNSEIKTSWKYDLATDRFEIITPHSDLKFLTSISTIDDFVSSFDAESEEKLFNLICKPSGSFESQSIRVLLATSSDDFMYCIVEILSFDENWVVGEIRVLFSLPQNHTLSNFFLGLFDNKHVGVVITDEKTEIVACNEKFESNTGYQLAELIGKKTNIFNSGKLDDQFFDHFWAKINGDGFWSGQILSKTKSGLVIPQDLTIQSLILDSGKTFYIGYGRNLKDAPDRVAGIENGGVDFLTQLPNKDKFRELIGEVICQLSDSESLFTVSWNPDIPQDYRYSYRKRVAEATRYFDDGISCGYLGDNKFIMVVKCDKAQLQNKVHLIKSVLTPMFLEIKQNLCKGCLKELQGTFFGVSILGLDSTSANQLLDNCLIALDEKHGNPERKLCFFNPRDYKANRRRSALEIIARKAIRHEEVEVYYQPIISTESWKVSKVEALCRFRDPSGNILNTQEMVSIVEDLGLAADLDLMVATKAINDKPALDRRYGANIGLSINVSLRHDSNRLASLNRLIGLIKNFDCRKSNIMFEITESAYFDMNARNHELLQFLKGRDIPIAIDDFGTGFSSLSYLRKSVFKVLKIDREFVTNLQENSRNHHIIKMIVKLAKVLNVKIVAEGVESISDALILTNMGVDMLQGHLFDQPKPLSELNSLPKAVYILKKTLQADSIASLYSDHIKIMPQSTLEDVRNIYNTDICEYLPVIYENRCVGIISRAIYNLHITPTLGTNIENARDSNALRKAANQVMSHQFSVIGDDLTTQNIINLVNKEIPFPWVVQSDEGGFMGIIEQTTIMKMLVKI